MTTKSLDIGKGAEFSLRALFDQKNLDVEPEEQCLDVPQEPVARKAHRIVFEREEVNHVEQQSYWKNAGMWTEPLFFSTGDTRFKEAVDFIHEPAKEEPYRDRNKWYEQREMLKQFYRNKMRRNLLWLAGTNQRTQQKRPLVDASDESSFQYFGQQDEIERQKEKETPQDFFQMKSINQMKANEFTI